MSSDGKISNQEKAAAVIVSLGVDKASQIYKYLSEEDIEQLTIAIAKLGYISVEQTEEILDDFYKMCLTQKVVTEGGMEYARTVLEKAFDEGTAHALLEKVSKSLKVKAFDYLRRTDIKSLYSVLQYERPQIIALVLAYVDSTKAAQVIASLPEEKRVVVVERIAKMESASPEAIKVVEAQLKNKFSSVMTTDFAKVGGIDYIAEVMNNMDRSNEKFIFDEMGKKDQELTDEIKKKMFVFEDIAGMDGRAIQIFVRECDIKDLVLAIKGTTEEVAKLIFANMSARMAENIKDELEITTNVRLKEVEEAQQRIVAVIRKLDEEGAIVLSKGGKDDIIA